MRKAHLAEANRPLALACPGPAAMHLLESSRVTRCLRPRIEGLVFTVEA
jgi:hypothetical protein